ncbi:hypothetical protein [Trichococcus alkaliphilus]|uniref:hypothetical protein n=1 Tax=Trichococcus alkaliphilus TaxID=2052943 RepID=UPI000D0B7970|nr:hypothetical protein [Trichococcus alkaliphilus]
MAELITETGKRKELLEVFEAEVAVLKELEKAVTKRADKVNNGDKARITARLTAIAKALAEVATVEAGKALMAEKRELTEELTLAERIEQNMQDGFKADLEQLAIPFYRQEAKAMEALRALYAETYNTTTPLTVRADLTAIKELNQPVNGAIVQVFHALAVHEVLGKSWNGNVQTKQVTAKNGERVTLGRGSVVNTEALEAIKQVVERGGI